MSLVPLLFSKPFVQCTSEVWQTRVRQPRSLPLTWPVVVLGTVTIRFFVRASGLEHTMFVNWIGVRLAEEQAHRFDSEED